MCPDRLMLPTYSLATHPATHPTLILAPNPQIISSPPLLASKEASPQRVANNSPTNLVASSSSSSTSGRLPAAISLSSSFSSGAISRSPVFSSPQNQSTPPKRNSLESSQRNVISKSAASSRSSRFSGLGVQKRYRRPHIYQHEVRCFKNQLKSLLIRN